MRRVVILFLEEDAAFLAAQAGLGTEGLSLEWFAVHPDRTMRLWLHPGQDQQMVLFDRDFSLCSEDRQPP